jgi:hypothetical protein
MRPQHGDAGGDGGPGPQRDTRWSPWLAALFAAGFAALLALPIALARWWLTEDSIEYLAIAHAWVHGEGFVNPVSWTYYASGAPFPATAMRAPAVSLLAAIPLALGASLSVVIQLHALWCSAIVGALVLVGRRFGLSTPAALASALLLGTAPAWLRISCHVWSEGTALLALLGVLATARGVVRSVRGALLCAALTWLAWLCRPNLAALALCVLVAAAWQLGWRGALRSAGCRAYALATLLALAASYALVSAWTGEAPYARYAALFQVLSADHAMQYATPYPGAAAFVWQNLGALLQRALHTAGELSRALLVEPRYNWVGWLGLLGFAHAFGRPGHHALERRTAALAGVGFALVAVFYLDFDATRFPLFTAATAALCGMASIDDFSRGLARRRRDAAAPPARLLAWLPLAPALAACVATLPISGWLSARMWQGWREHGTVSVAHREVDATIRAHCRHLEPDALVASPFPWHYHLWCGNAGLRLPDDLDAPGRLDRYLDREQPGYVVARGQDAALAASVRLRPLTQNAGLVVYRVLQPGNASRPWRAPPPLACAGRAPDCVQQMQESAPGPDRGAPPGFR